MKPDLQTALFCRYPQLFRKPGKRFIGPETIPDLIERLQDDMAPFDERGLECGDEWFPLVDRLSQACELEIEALSFQGVPPECWPRIAQIKEKFGSLRFYVTGPLSDQLRAQILQAEANEGVSLQRHNSSHL